jgi:hypothetical protein
VQSSVFFDPVAARRSVHPVGAFPPADAVGGGFALVTARLVI